MDHSDSAPRRDRFGRIRDFTSDAAMVLLVAFLFPLVILLIGAPVMLAVRGAIEIARRC